MHTANLRITKEKHQYDLGSEEMLYMTVHIALLVKHK